MSTPNLLGRLDRRFGENRVYVFAQIYLLAGVLSTLVFYAALFIFVPDLLFSLGWLNLLIIATSVLFPFMYGLKYAVAILLVSTYIVYWRYKRLYRGDDDG